MEAVASRRTQLHGLVSSLHLALGAKRPASWQLPARSTPPYLPYKIPGDVVVVANLTVFWGIVRYAVSPSWGYPLAIMPLKSNEAWTGLKTKLGPEMVEKLHLNPAADFVDSKAVRYVIGTKADHLTENSARIWIVHRNNYKETVELVTPVKVDHVTWFGNELSVSLMIRNPAGARSVSNPQR